MSLGESRSTSSLIGSITPRLSFEGIGQNALAGVVKQTPHHKEIDNVLYISL